MLSKKYYNEFARIIRDSNDKDDMVLLMLSFFRNDNPRFNQEKFEAACMEAD
jgi:hypothetical protein